MRNKKAFTLIELLVVIAILAVILLIASPIILGALDKAKKNNFKNQALLYVDGLKKEVLLDSVVDNPNIVLPSKGKSLSMNISDIPMDGDTDLTGNIVITNKGNGNYSYTLYVTNGEYIICNKEHNKIKIEDIKKGDTCGDSFKFLEINLELLTVGSGNINDNIIENNIIQSSNYADYALYFEDSGYTFNYELGYGEISFCDSKNSCETIASGTPGPNGITIKNGSYLTPKPGYIRMRTSASSIKINNIEYNGTPVSIIRNNFTNIKFPLNVVLKNNCTVVNGNFSCENNNVSNNSVVSGTVYIVIPHSPYTSSTEFKINDGEWINPSLKANASGIYYEISTPGTYKIKLRSNFNNLWYSQESDEFVITIN